MKASRAVFWFFSPFSAFADESSDFFAGDGSPSDFFVGEDSVPSPCNFLIVCPNNGLAFVTVLDMSSLPELPSLNLAKLTSWIY